MAKAYCFPRLYQSSHCSKKDALKVALKFVPTVQKDYNRLQGYTMGAGKNESFCIRTDKKEDT